MRLNHDCIRDIILHVEENSNSTTHMHSAQFKNSLVQYDEETLKFHVMFLANDGYLLEPQRMASGDYLFTDLTSKGHRFAHKLRTDKNANIFQD
ncbi:DUF2513 domain-containing protein [Turicibacter sanguinis]|uniref:DUF2513 domain-containing protein n=1 Tax=Turicibacter sanguinis TaxID=154288 RepID=UPI00241E1223|nr:DUF2513 domain-containing protein [Turicibacter sanguinis]